MKVRVKCEVNITCKMYKEIEFSTRHTIAEIHIKKETNTNSSTSRKVEVNVLSY